MAKRRVLSPSDLARATPEQLSLLRNFLENPGQNRRRQMRIERERRAAEVETVKTAITLYYPHMPDEHARALAEDPAIRQAFTCMENVSAGDMECLVRRIAVWIGSIVGLYYARYGEWNESMSRLK